jgi:hypothetical protein
MKKKTEKLNLEMVEKPTWSTWAWIDGKVVTLLELVNNFDYLNKQNEKS